MGSDMDDLDGESDRVGGGRCEHQLQLFVARGCRQAVLDSCCWKNKKQKNSTRGRYNVKEGVAGGMVIGLEEAHRTR